MGATLSPHHSQAWGLCMGVKGGNPSELEDFEQGCGSIRE